MRTLGLGGVVALAAVAAPAPVAAESQPPPDAPTVTVYTVAELRAAMELAVAGDIIEVAPGTYVIDEPLHTVNPGAPGGVTIVVRSTSLGRARFESNVAEAFKVDQPYWEFLFLDVYGTCLDDSTCEHAFHITGEADATRIYDCTLVDFNAQIKGNGEPIGPSGTYMFPDDVSITNSRLYDTRPRQTSNPVTKIDVVGGRRWTISKNRIADFEKAGGDGVSYGAFLKGNSRDGAFVANTVVCADEFTGGSRIGLSLGGGGSGPDPICEDGTCTPEHQNGLIANNLIGHCSDVGIYLNEAADSRIAHNTIIDTLGIDVRYEASTAMIYNNLLTGTIDDREGGTHISETNLVQLLPSQWDRWFVAPEAFDFGLENGEQIIDAGVGPTTVTSDFCDNYRDDDHPDIGAIEYDDDVEDLLVMCSRVSPPYPADADPGGGDDDGGAGDGGGCCGAAGGDPAGSLALAGVLAAVLGRRTRRTRRTRA